MISIVQGKTYWACNECAEIAEQYSSGWSASEDGARHICPSHVLGVSTNPDYGICVCGRKAVGLCAGVPCCGDGDTGSCHGLRRDVATASGSPVPHYYLRNGFDVFDVAEAWGLSFAIGSALKYLCRAGHKTPDPREDWRKAMACIQRQLEQYERVKAGGGSK